MNRIDTHIDFHDMSWKKMLVSIFIASIIAGFASYISIMISEAYYSIAPFHYDSVSYRLIGIRLYRVMQEKGLFNAILTSIPTRDDLDVTIRLLVAPKSLLNVYGHMFVLVPFMIGTFTLMIIYVYSKTESWSLSVIPLLFFFTFQQVYNPVQGIADYWKDNIAVWIIGCFVMTLIMSEYFRRRWWSFACGSMFGLLVLQRAGVAILMVVLLLPILATMLFPRIRKYGFKEIREGITYFLLPAIIFSGFFIVFDLEEFYVYNFKVGYDFWTLSKTYNNFIEVLSVNKSYWLTIPLIIMLTLYSVYTKNKKNYTNAVFVMSAAILFPIEIICLKMYYHSTLSVVMVFILITLAMTVVSFSANSRPHKLTVTALIALAIMISVFQYETTEAASRNKAVKDAPWRKLDENITDTLLQFPKPYNLIILYDEVWMAYLNHAFFNRGIPILTTDGINFAEYFWVHDTYYQHRHGANRYEDVFEHYVDAMQKKDGTFAISYCEPDDANNADHFRWDSKKIAVPLTINLTRYLKSNQQWRVVNKFNSPEGNLCVYRYSSKIDVYKAR